MKVERENRMNKQKEHTIKLAYRKEEKTAYIELCEFWQTYWFKGDRSQTYTEVLAEIERKWHLMTTKTLFSPLKPLGESQKIKEASEQFLKIISELTIDENVTSFINREMKTYKKKNQEHARKLLYLHLLDWEMLTDEEWARTYRQALSELFLRIEGFELDREDPRLMVFHERDLAYMNQKIQQLDHTKNVSKTARELLNWMNFIRQVNMQEPLAYFGERIATEKIPQPSVPQPFRGDVLRKQLLLVGINTNFEYRLGEREPYHLPKEEMALREATLKDLRRRWSDPHRKVQPLVFEEQQIKRIKKMTVKLLRQPYRFVNTLYKQDSILLKRTFEYVHPETKEEYVFASPFNKMSIATMELLPYQISGRSEFTDQLVDELPSAKLALNFCRAALDNPKRIVILRRYSEILARLGVNEESVENHVFQGIDGRIILTQMNLVSGREKKRIAELEKNEQFEERIERQRSGDLIRRIFQIRFTK